MKIILALATLLAAVTAQTAGQTMPPRMCRGLQPADCWGPGFGSGAGVAVCAFDSDDMECSAIDVNKPEGICTVYQMRRDVAGCTASQFCYYDSSDQECTENGELENPGIMIITQGEDGMPEGEFETDHERELEWEHEHESEFEPEDFGPVVVPSNGLPGTSTGNGNENNCDYLTQEQCKGPGHSLQPNGHALCAWNAAGTPDACATVEIATSEGICAAYGVRQDEAGCTQSNRCNWDSATTGCNVVSGQLSTILWGANGLPVGDFEYEYVPTGPNYPVGTSGTGTANNGTSGTANSGTSGTGTANNGDGTGSSSLTVTNADLNGITYSYSSLNSGNVNYVIQPTTTTDLTSDEIINSATACSGTQALDSTGSYSASCTLEAGDYTLWTTTADGTVLSANFILSVIGGTAEPTEAVVATDEPTEAGVTTEPTETGAVTSIPSEAVLVTAEPTGAVAAAPTTAGSATDVCTGLATTTSGTCTETQACYEDRGSTVCTTGACVCAEGYYSANGYSCVPCTDSTASTTDTGSLETGTDSSTYRVSWGMTSSELEVYRSDLESSFANLLGVTAGDVSVAFASDNGSSDSIATYIFPTSTDSTNLVSSSSFSQNYVDSVNAIDGLTYQYASSTGTGGSGTTGTTGNGMPKNCQMQSPENCFGVGMSSDGHALCAYDLEDLKCMAIETDSSEGICKIYDFRGDVEGCENSPHCYYDTSDAECTENGELEIAPAGSSIITYGEDGIPENEFEYDHEWEVEHEESEFGSLLKKPRQEETNSSTTYTLPIFYFLAAFSGVCLGFGLSYGLTNKCQKEDEQAYIHMDNI